MAVSGRTDAAGDDPAGRLSGELARRLPAGAALLVAFSGGRDSTVLLHALAGLRTTCRFTLRAAHVNHGLNDAAADWAAHCTAVAGRLGVPLLSLGVEVRDERGHGIEAAARTARYAALARALEPGEWLVTGHHADDQLETVLLHLLRGSGVAGLAGIPATAAFGAGHLARPMLHVPSRIVQDYAEQVLRPGGFAWLADPMNADPARDRNYLRHQLLLVLLWRFLVWALPSGRTAGLAAEAAGLLEELAAKDAGLVQDPRHTCRLDLARLRGLEPARRQNLIRHLARRRGWAVPPERRLRVGLPPLLDAGSGKQPVLRWAGHEIRRYRGHLYLLDAGVGDAVPGTPLPWSGEAPLELGDGRGWLLLRPCNAAAAGSAGRGLEAGLVAAGLTVGFRDGGERLCPVGDAHHRSLKYLFQSQGIVPWMRPRIPLLRIGGRLAAVGNLWIASWAAANHAEEALEIVWRDHGLLQ